MKPDYLTWYKKQLIEIHEREDTFYNNLTMPLLAIVILCV